MFAEKTALITGGTRGIGKATAQLLRASGARVFTTGRRPTSGNDFIACDVADLASIEALMRNVAGRLAAAPRVRKLDILVINAGISHAPDIADMTAEAYDTLMNVNVRGAVFTFVNALPLLADGASVVFVGSVGGRKGQPGDALYSGSKGFIRAFARNAGTDPELMARKIRVNVVAPGPIATELTKDATADAQISAYVEGLIPMRRWGQAEEVAKAIAFLASDASSFTTGAELTVDGGMAHA